MSSTPRHSQLAPSDSKNTPSALEIGQQLPFIHRFRLNSIGTKLLVPVVGGVIIGMSGINFLFGEIVKYQAEERIQQVLSDQVNLLESRLEQTEILATTLRTSALTLHMRRAQVADTYRQLVFELFKERSNFIGGLGLGQSPNGLLPQQQWFSAYYYLNEGATNAEGIQLSQPYGDIRYVDGTRSDPFYADSDRYQTYFAPQKDVWSQPYSVSDQLKIAYYAQMVDDQGNWLGTAFAELNTAELTELLDTPIFNQAGYTVFLTNTGQILTQATASKDIEPATTYQSIPGLEAVWSQMTEPAGLLEGETGYWAYERMPQGNWITVAFVPYGAVFSQVNLITIGGTLAVGALLTLIVTLIIRSLNRRLQPLLDECHRLAGTNAEFLVRQQRQDELGQLSTAFFGMLERLKLDEEQMRQDLAHRVQTEERLDQMTVTEKTSQTLQTEVAHISQVLSAVEAGNLTVAAQVSSGTIGLLAESLNRLVERLGQVMAIALHSTKQVVQESESLERAAVIVAENAQRQTQSVAQVQTLMTTVDELSQGATFHVQETTEAVQSTRTAALQGQQEIAAISKGIGGLQQSTNQIAKRIQTLSSYVELANQFAKDQKRIAAMTRVLAVNASMLANRAAVQHDPEHFTSITREFETVAAQVDELASQTNQSLISLQRRTDQIQTTVSGLDYDVQEISQQVNDFTVGVAHSQQALDTIQSASQQVEQTWQQVVQSNHGIATSAQTALQSVQTILAIADETTSQAGMTQEQTRHLDQLAQTLLQTVEFFQLRSDQMQSVEFSPIPMHPLSPDRTVHNGRSLSEGQRSLPISITTKPQLADKTPKTLDKS